MEKMKMQTGDVANENFRKLAELFPNAVTETIEENGEVVRAIDKDILMQEISTRVVEGNEERYQFTWPDKRQAMRLASTPIAATLRPCRDESVNFDTTQNLYIEGDNLDVLKLLRETYLGKVKMIYIDPPYNTGNDFVYDDDFAEDGDEFLFRDNQYDAQGNRLVQNTESNGRFHTDWLNMIYPRLKVAKDLLSDDGVIFISIDDHELYNLKKITDEIFGGANYLGTIVIKSNPRGSMSTAEIASLHENLLVYSKDRQFQSVIGHKLTESMDAEYKYTDSTGRYRLLGLRMRGGFWRRADRPKLYYPIFVAPSSGEISLEKNSKYTIEVLPIQPTTGEDGTWRWSTEKVLSEKDKLVAKEISRNSQSEWDIFQKDYLDKGCERRTKAKSIWDDSELNYQNGTTEVKNLLGKSGIFDYSKPICLLKKAIEMISINENDIILDFFSGSATTAHAVMQLNAEDGGKRKFIMVQLPEVCEEKSEAAKAGYKNICEIGKERIRRAGKKVVEEAGLTAADLDIGFRVLKLDSSNMEDVYYAPDKTSQNDLLSLISNIKPDRTPEDLLFQVMLEFGITLDSKIEETVISDKKVFKVAGNFLIACFDDNVTDDVVKAIAQATPAYAVLRDSSFANDSVAANFEQIFATYSPDTVRRVL